MAAPASEIEKLSARVAALDDALSTARAEAEAREVEYQMLQQAAQKANEELRDDNSSLRSRALDLQNDVDRLQKEKHAVQQQLHESSVKVAQMSRMQVRIQELVTDKELLNAQLDDKKQRLEELENQLRRATAETKTLVAENSQLQAALQVSSTDHAAELRNVQLEQTVKFLESKVQYLEEELQRKTDALIQTQKHSTNETLSLRSKLSELEHTAQVSQVTRTQQLQRIKELEEFLAESRRRTKEAEEARVAAEEHFARQMAQMQAVVDE